MHGCSRLLTVVHQQPHGYRPNNSTCSQSCTVAHGCPRLLTVVYTCSQLQTKQLHVFTVTHGVFLQIFWRVGMAGKCEALKMSENLSIQQLPWQQSLTVVCRQPHHHRPKDCTCSQLLTFAHRCPQFSTGNLTVTAQTITHTQSRSHLSIVS